MEAKRILIVDDNKRITRTIRILMEKSGGYVVYEEHDPTMALDDAVAFRPDAVVLDMNMPGMSGRDVARKMRQNVTTKDIPILFLTAFQRKTASRAREWSVDGEHVLTKPVSIKELTSHIEQCISLREHQRAPRRECVGRARRIA